MNTTWDIKADPEARWLPLVWCPRNIFTATERTPRTPSRPSRLTQMMTQMLMISERSSQARLFDAPSRTVSRQPTSRAHPVHVVVVCCLWPARPARGMPFGCLSSAAGEADVVEFRGSQLAAERARTAGQGEACLRVPRNRSLVRTLVSTGKAHAR